MGKVDNFFIYLDNRDAVYISGQNVSGRVNLDLNKDIKIKSIKISLYGYADVSWEEHEGNKKVQYRSTEVYVEEHIDLLTESSDTVQRKGHYSYPFNVMLPDDAPSSYESVTGQVRYKVNALIDISSWTFDKKQQQIITVVNQLDLNTLGPTMMNGDEHSDSKTMCCWFCKSDPYTATVKVDRRGFVPGETITFSAEVNNMSNRDMKYTKAKLQMQVTYHCKFFTKKTNHVLFKTKRDVKIPKGETDVWMNGKLPITPVPPSYLTGCSIIDINYLVTLVVVPCGFEDMDGNLHVSVEVVIGSIPLADIARGYGVTRSSALPPPNPGVSSDTSTSSALPTHHFATSAFGAVIVKENDWSSGTEYTPKYAYYNWNRPTPSETFDIVGQKS